MVAATAISITGNEFYLKITAAPNEQFIMQKG